MPLMYTSGKCAEVISPTASAKKKRKGLFKIKVVKKRKSEGDNGGSAKKKKKKSGTCTHHMHTYVKVFVKRHKIYSAHTQTQISYIQKEEGGRENCAARLLVGVRSHAKNYLVETVPGAASNPLVGLLAYNSDASDDSSDADDA